MSLVTGHAPLLLAKNFTHQSPATWQLPVAQKGRKSSKGEARKRQPQSHAIRTPLKRVLSLETVRYVNGMPGTNIPGNASITARCSPSSLGGTAKWRSMAERGLINQMTSKPSARAHCDCDSNCSGSSRGNCDASRPLLAKLKVRACASAFQLNRITKAET